MLHTEVSVRCLTALCVAGARRLISRPNVSAKHAPQPQLVRHTPATPAGVAAPVIVNGAEKDGAWSFAFHNTLQLPVTWAFEMRCLGRCRSITYLLGTSKPCFCSAGNFTFHGVHHVALICSNLERSLEFYQGLLGECNLPDLAVKETVM